MVEFAAREQRVDDARDVGSGLAMAACAPNNAGLSRWPTQPISPAARMIAGNGTLARKMARKAAMASATIARFFSARRLILKPASITTASTAALMPKNSPSTSGPRDRARRGCSGPASPPRRAG